ncbi:PREDICTED: lipase member K-like [Nicrophorus vespilloides]|uniref:Lipase n=1 Tax=Nicrophorus vespilloides TaxID=110193 RepID=A0ABM1MRP2_NICVS|nr:PREDICTED: lipase member K-like [Nicrophorus vespilloides]
MMLIYILTILLITKIGICVENNVCTTVEGYSMKENNNLCKYNPDVFSNTWDMVQRHGYPIEKHNTVTKDGYILTIYRIPHGKERSFGGQPVYLLHGTLSSSEMWVNIGNKSLAFKLADRGYDVWIGDARGNFNSLGHIKHDIDSNEYWNYTLDDLAYYDMPAVLNYISNETGKGGEIIHLGHSQGSLVALMYASRLPSHAKSHLKGLVLIGPVTYIRPVSNLITKMYSVLTSLIPYVGDRSNAITRFCTMNSYFFNICIKILDLSCGSTKDTYVLEDMPIFFSYCLYQESTKPINHIAQLGNSQRCQMYDYGPKGNLEVYQSDYPPEYNISRINIPTYLFVGENDTIASPKHGEFIYRNLTIQEKGLFVLKGFNHVSLFYSKYLETEFHRKLK